MEVASDLRGEEREKTFQGEAEESEKKCWMWYL